MQTMRINYDSLHEKVIRIRKVMNELRLMRGEIGLEIGRLDWEIKCRYDIEERMTNAAKNSERLATLCEDLALRLERTIDLVQSAENTKGKGIIGAGPVRAILPWKPDPFNGFLPIKVPPVIGIGWIGGLLRPGGQSILITDPVAKQADDIKYYEKMLANKSTLASIKNGDEYTSFYGKDNMSYNAKNDDGSSKNLDGQCTWYAYGRFAEVTGIKLGTAGMAKDWLTNNASDTNLNVMNKASDICSNSIAVSKIPSKTGHVMFVEYVERDSSGNPINVYFTESNWDANGEYEEGTDCILKKFSYADFLEKRNPSGYITKK